MDRGHFVGLAVLDHDVVEEVAVVLVHAELAHRREAADHDFVGVERGREVDERLLEVQQVRQRAVLHRVVEFALDGVGLVADFAEVAQVEGGGAEEDVEDEAVADVGRADLAHLPELVGEGGPPRADRDDGVGGDDDAVRDRRVGRQALAGLLDGDADDDEGGARVLVGFDTGPFVLVQGVGEELRNQVEGGLDLVHFRLRRFREVDPHARLELVAGLGQPHPLRPFVGGQHTPTILPRRHVPRQAEECAGWRSRGTGARCP